jgi:regulator of replication initiation timing
LLVDLQNKQPPHEESRTDSIIFKATVVHLLSDNSELTNENKKLKERLEMITAKYNQIQENNSKSIFNWKEKWNLHHGSDNNSYPALDFE